MNPAPFFFVPGAKPQAPACCPHHAPFRVAPGGGPNADLDSEGKPRDPGGFLYGIGARIPDGVTWQKTAAGWYVAWNGQQPQDLARLNTHPRILAWRWIIGAELTHRWRVPILIAPEPKQQADLRVFTSALDRAFGPNGWEEPHDLEPLAQILFALSRDERVRPDIDANNMILVETAAALAGLGHWVDLPLISSRTGWFTDLVVTRILRASSGLEPDPALPEDIA